VDASIDGVLERVRACIDRARTSLLSPAIIYYIHSRRGVKSLMHDLKKILGAHCSGRHIPTAYVKHLSYNLRAGPAADMNKSNKAYVLCSSDAKDDGNYAGFCYLKAATSSHTNSTIIQKFRCDAG
jgi:hypothetical protein